MKRILLFLAFSSLLAAAPASLLGQTIFVKASAVGAATGGSWADAFTTLDAALLVAVPGSQVWVAAGTYKPLLGAVANKSFTIVAGVELYGGFAGTEGSLSDRNYLTNVTTLSGDLSGNDVAGDLTMNRSDNSWHVLVVGTSTATQRAVVDGFVIRNGNTKVATADPDATKRGGGIYTTAKLTVRNCTFTENEGLIGGALSTQGASGSGLIVDNCIFDHNLSTNSSAGIYMASSTSSSINRCIFRNNITNRGSLYPNQCSGMVVDSCLFQNNTAGTDQWGAGIYNWQSSYTLTNSTFKGNVAHNAAGIYNDGREGNDSFVIDNCIFEENSTTNYGGTAIFNSEANSDIKNCSFLKNAAPTSAGAIYIGGAATPNTRIVNCLFDNGTAAFGAGIANYSVPGQVSIEGCTFSNNSAVTSGGALTNGFLANTSVKGCVFQSNSARFGGAIFLQNDSTTLTVDSSLFEGNNGTDVGGGIYCSAGNFSSITNSTFTLNSSNSGAALVISEDSLDLANSVIDRCVFRENFGMNQAGAINVENADVTITNSLFAGNQVIGTGAGGAVLVNGFGKKTANLTAVNCTWGSNIGPLGAGLAEFEGDSGHAVVNLQNCVFSDIGNTYAVEDGAPVVNSLGGNLSMDASLAVFLTATNDLNETDPLFVDPNNYDFHLLEGSPCIDKGIASGAPTVDLEGNLRVGAPDMGSYEYLVVGTHTPSVQRLPLQLQPNPTTDFVRTTITNNWQGNVDVQIIDAAGRVARHLTFEKSGSELSLELRVAELPKGAYLVQVQMGAVRMSGSLVKM